MRRTHVHTTTLQDIRSLLDAHGGAPPPWSAPAQVVEQLYQVLRARSADEALWRDLEALAARVEARQMDRSTRHRDILAGGATDALLADLRVALRRGDGDERSLRQRVLEALGGPGLATFLLLGTATSCSDDTESKYDCGSDDSEQAQVYCELRGAVRGSGISAHRKDEMYRCLNDMDAAERAGLLDRFSTLDDEALADELKLLTGDCNSCDYDASDDDCAH